MNHNTIKKLQREYGISDMQEMIDNGQVWHMEGSMGRAASHLLTVGICMLPKQRHRDYWGNIIPSRDDLKPYSKGTYGNALRFWSSDEFEDYL